jgi:hypothetical protein
MRTFLESLMRTLRQNQAVKTQRREFSRYAGPEIALQLTLGVALIAIGGICYFSGKTTEGTSIAAIGLLTLYLT